MYQFLYKLYFFLLRDKSYEHFFQKVFTLVANIVFPFYFYCTRCFTSNQLEKNEFTENKKDYFVVSLTSFPKRIDKLWLCIETILRQEVKPNELILWLYEGEFNGLDSLPKKLLEQQKRGLQIKFCKENLMPHKKYYYAMKEFPNANIITIDDDLFLPLDLIKRLKEFHIKFPTEILSTIAMEIKMKNNALLPYVDWPYIKSNRDLIYGGLPVGVGSILYPPNSIHPDVFDMNSIFKYCLKADDLWLKIMSVRQKTKVLCLADLYPRFFIFIIIKNNSNLMDENVTNGQNDEILKSLLRQYNISTSDFKNHDFF